MSGKPFKRFKKFQLFQDTPDVDSKLVIQLAKLPLFKNTPQDVLAKIARQVKIHNLAADEVLLRKGAPSGSLFIIRSGWVKVISEDASGKEVVLNHLGPGQVIGEMSLIDQRPRSNTAVVIRPVEVMEIEYSVILDVLNDHPILARSLLQEMFNRVRFANAYVEETVEWCRHIAAGNYDFVQEQVEQTKSTVVDMTKSNQARASAFLSVFFKMIEDVKTRELKLKQQVHRLTIQIDEAKRQQAVAELTDTEFFEDLQTSVQRMREDRKAKQRKQSGFRDDSSEG